MNDQLKKVLQSMFLIFSGVTFGGIVLLPFLVDDISTEVYNNPYIISYLVLWILVSFVTIYSKDK